MVHVLILQAKVSLKISVWDSDAGYTKADFVDFLRKDITIRNPLAHDAPVTRHIILKTRTTYVVRTFKLFVFYS